MIRALIFDCFGVLYQGDMEFMLDKAGGKRDELRDIFYALDYGRISYDEFCEQSANLLKLTPERIRTLAGQHHVRNDQLFELVKSFRGTYKLGILSNAGKGVLPKLFGEDFSLFDTVVTSSDIGFIKPSPEIFMHTLQKIEVAADECLFVDDVEENVAAAQKLGIKAVVYTDYQSLVRDLTDAGVLSA